MKILIVEDDRHSAKLLAKFLEPFGDCDFSTDGKQAIQNVKYSYREEDPYDLICLDIMMPNMDGQNALKEIRNYESRKNIQIGNGAKIIMVTALSDTDNMMRSFVRLCDAYIVKPINKNELYDKLKEVSLVEA